MKSRVTIMVIWGDSQQKTLAGKIFIMDIKARIEEVIAQRGLTKREVSERMGKFNQAFNSLITNPKWDTIELVAEAIGITIEELLFDQSRIGSNSTISLTNEEDMLIHPDQCHSQTIGLLLCPYCGKGIRLNIEKQTIFNKS